MSVPSLVPPSGYPEVCGFGYFLSPALQGEFFWAFHGKPRRRGERGRNKGLDLGEGKCVPRGMRIANARTKKC